MYNVLIADDSAQLRSGLKCMFDWEKAGYTVAAEAANGREALERLGEAPFHVLLTDIQMPGMDGIELIKSCSEAYPGLEIIIISGYDDFAYAKTAIQFGIMDYLLKPIVRSELKGVLDKIRLKLEARSKEQSERSLIKWKLNQHVALLQEQFLMQLVNDNDNGNGSSGSLEERALQLQLGHVVSVRNDVQFIGIEMRIPPGRLEGEHTRSDMMRLAFQMMCRDVAQLHGEHALVFHDYNFANMMFVIVRLDESDDSRVRRIAEDITNNMNRYLRIDTRLGIGKPCAPFTGLKTGYVTCLFAWSRGFAHEGADAETGAGESAVPNGRAESMPELEKRLSLALEKEDFEAFALGVRAFFAAGKDADPMEDSILFMRIILMLNSLCRKYKPNASKIQDYTWICYYSVWKFESREKVLEQIFRLAEYAAETIGESKKSGTASIVDAVRDYIDRHYAFELSLSLIAEDFHFNETYLSKIFKKQIGKTFSEYVLEVRMSQAVRLLRQSDLNLDEIAGLVGISNASYFSNVFKRRFGCSPKAYRSQQNTTGEG